jgi:hypothetical protein
MTRARELVMLVALAKGLHGRVGGRYGGVHASVISTI